jgi:predicted DNA-binding transcriptional regulator YafY
MPFERSLEIERRLDEILRLIATGRFSTPMLAEAVGVSIPTISRIVAALRDRGHDIQADRTSKGWRYRLVSSARLTSGQAAPAERR